MLFRDWFTFGSAPQMRPAAATLPSLPRRRTTPQDEWPLQVEAADYAMRELVIYVDLHSGSRGANAKWEEKRVMPSSFDGSFDFFTVMPPIPLDLSKDEEYCLLSLLVEYSEQCEGHWDPERVPESMYKHLQLLLHIMLHLQVNIICEQAYILVKAVVASSGAFDENFAEIDAWFGFLAWL